MEIKSDIKILDSLLALNLDVTLWSARKKMTLEDLGGAELPPEDLASLGSKRIADPESIKVFATLKSRAVNYLDRHGIRFMSGWALPEDKAERVVQELIKIRDEFLQAKEAFLADYDTSIQTWIARHSQWSEIIRNSTVGSDYVRSRINFRWQMFKVAPLARTSSESENLHAGLEEEVTQLGSTLFQEIARSAEDMWHKIYAGKNEVTHRALSPLKTLYDKLVSLSFIEPHVAPVTDIIQATLQRMPARGNIGGTDLLLLQGLISLLRTRDDLLVHASRLMAGQEPSSVLDSLLQPSSRVLWQEKEAPSDEPVLPPILTEQQPLEQLPSMGLW